jgi:hypothetical protein
MKPGILIISILFLFSLTSCDETDIYNQRIKTIDSLDGAVNAMLNEMNRVDTLLLKSSVIKYQYFRQFIKQQIYDTVSKIEADQLQQFNESGSALEAFLKNRYDIIGRASLLNSQLEKLSSDARGRKLDKERLMQYTMEEKAQASSLIAIAQQQKDVFHRSLEEFNNTVDPVEQIIRSRNKGELPRILVDTTN